MLVNAQPVCGDDAIRPPTHLVFGGRHDVLAVAAVPGVDLVVLTEASDRADALLAHFAERDRRSVVEPVREVLDVTPERVDEAAVAPAGAAARDVLLDDRDVDPRVHVREMQRGPHPRVAATEDHDVGRRVATERRRGFAGIVGERVAQPPASTGVRGDGCLQAAPSSLLGCSPASSQAPTKGIRWPASTIVPAAGELTQRSFVPWHLALTARAWPWQATTGQSNCGACRRRSDTAAHQCFT